MRKRSAMLSHLLTMCLPRLGRLSTQYWPNLLWGQFNNTLQVTVLCMTNGGKGWVENLKIGWRNLWMALSPAAKRPNMKFQDLLNTGMPSSVSNCHSHQPEKNKKQKILKGSYRGKLNNGILCTVGIWMRNYFGIHIMEICSITEWFAIQMPLTMVVQYSDHHLLTDWYSDHHLKTGPLFRCLVPWYRVSE